MDFSRYIAAHGQWRNRLRTVIDTGRADVTLDMIKTDTKCDFGRFFYRLPAETQNGEVARRVRQIHAAFHAEAARVLALGLRGDKLEANRALELGSEFAKLSSELARALHAWQRKSAA